MNAQWILAKIKASLNTLMPIVAGIISVSVLYGATLWLILYLKDPNQPYIGGSLFTMAQVVTIFGGFSIAAAFSERVGMSVRSVLRYVGGLHLFLR